MSCSNDDKSTIEIFNFKGEDVRVVLDERGEPWWVVTDLAKVLGYRDGATAARLLRDHQRSYTSLCTSGGERTAIIANKGGMYRLVMRSNREEAEEFQDWVTDEVIPSLLETGSYSITKEPIQPAYTLPPDYASALRALADEVEAKAVLEARVAELEPQAEAWSTFIDRADMYEFGTAAKLLSMDPSIDIGRQRLFDWMGGRGDLYRDRDGRGREFWVPSQRRIDAGHLALKFGATYEVKGERLPAPPKVVIPGDAMMYWWRQIKADGRFDKRRGLRVVSGDDAE